jgi:hypothetical protein
MMLVVSHSPAMKASRSGPNVASMRIIRSTFNACTHIRQLLVHALALLLLLVVAVVVMVVVVVDDAAS